LKTIGANSHHGERQRDSLSSKISPRATSSRSTLPEGDAAFDGNMGFTTNKIFLQVIMHCQQLGGFRNELDCCGEGQDTIKESLSSLVIRENTFSTLSDFSSNFLIPYVKSSPVAEN
jgi:hypothetical protein